MPTNLSDDIRALIQISLKTQVDVDVLRRVFKDYETAVNDTIRLRQLMNDEIPGMPKWADRDPVNRKDIIDRYLSDIISRWEALAGRTYGNPQR